MIPLLLQFAEAQYLYLKDERDKASALVASTDPNLPATSRLEALAAEVGYYIALKQCFALIEFLKAQN